MKRHHTMRVAAIVLIAHLPVTARDSALSGAWTINRELSSPAYLSPDSDSEERQRTPEDGPSRWGSRAGGFGGGQIPGRPNPEEVRRVRNTMAELLRAPATLVITQTADEVTFVDPDGRSRKYRTNGKRQKNQLVSGVVDSETTWDGTVLAQKVSAARNAGVTFNYAVDGAFDRLIVTVERHGARDSEGPALRWVYDRVQ